MTDETELTWAAFLSSFGSTRFSELRPGQKQILDAYSSTHSASPNVAVELPTGAGKTLVALLIAERRRREGGTVAVLTGNKALAAQMESEGQALGVPVARMEGRGEDIPLSLRRKYRRAEAVGVMNYWVMFNSNPVVESADLLIIDDAHLAEGALETRFSVQIDRYAHPLLFRNLVEELATRLPDYASLEDAQRDDADPWGSIELMAYLDQALVGDRMREIIDNAAELPTDSDLRFRWRYVRDRFAETNIYLGRQSILIRPYCLPTQTLPRWTDPTQRLYLSATIGDPADLQRRLGSGVIEKIDADVANSTLGRRLIVLNNDFQAADDVLLSESTGTVVLEALRCHPKALWLCSSKAQVERWKASILPWLAGHGLPDSPAWILGSQGDEIEHFRSSESGHLFVAGRFDGMDFSRDECRLAIVTTLPRAINDQEQFVSDYLRDADFLVGRTNQRIVQALGRCNRTDDDYAVYVLADRRFASHLGQEANRRGLPASVQAELDLAEEFDELDSPTRVDRITAFLAGNFEAFDAQLTEMAVAVPAEPAHGTDSANDEVKGWLAMTGRQDYRAAELAFKARQERLAELQQRELGAFQQYTQAKAAHLEGLRGDMAAAQRSRTALEQAISRGGSSTSWFNRLRASSMRSATVTDDAISLGKNDFRAACARAFDEQLEATPPGARLDRWLARLADDLAADSHDVFVRGLGCLGETLGYTSVFPRYGAATDCRWRGVFGNMREALTFEAKIEHSPSGEISSRAVGQAHNQSSRALVELGPSGYSVRGLIVTHLERLSAEAAPSLGTTVVLRRRAVDALHQCVRERLITFAANWSLDDSTARVSAGESLATRLPDTGWLIEAIDAADRFLDADELLAAWPD